PYTDEESYKGVVRCDIHRNISLQVARESIVLLQNKNQLLPLTDYKRIALLGPSSGVQRIGSYSSVPYGYRVPNVYEEMKRLAGGKLEIEQYDGCGISDHDIDIIPESWYEDGVEVQFFNNGQFEGDPLDCCRMKCINFNWMLAKPHKDLEFNGYSVRMKGELNVDTHSFTERDSIRGRLIFSTKDSVRVWVDGVCVIDSFQDGKQDLPQCEFTFIHGAKHNVEVEYVCDAGGWDVTLGIDFHNDSIEEALEVAKRNDVIILVCGDDKVTSGEGMDRCELKLYGMQRELVRRVAEIGKPVVLVLETGKPVDLQEESEMVDAILEAWFGGELGATAIAEVLLGMVNPSGRLPISFPRSVGHLPCYYSRQPGGYPAYLEGTQDALYPFGYGLGYTEFEYRDLKVNKSEGDPCAYRASVIVQNTGNRTGADVVQLYVNDVACSIIRPDKLLQGFQWVELEPGEAREVVFDLNFESFRLYNLKHEWVVEAGEFEIMIGYNSRDIVLRERIRIPENVHGEQ
ncbi:MAG: glycoside hydrolase family 3 C-terminal domain-containing protein, partial [Candidatus Methanomethylophilaceae archaeon]|nr:glycoside hydrolase family 3 C-terminal domain-containing protein [Candidatus Methanomethylophilaceae archaeon]